VTIPVCIAVAMLAGPIVRLWVGDSFETAAQMLTLFAWFLALTLPFSICGCVVTAYAKVALPSRVGFVVALLNVALGLLLSGVMGMGILGIAFANAVAWMLYSSGFLPAYMCRVAQLSYARFWRDTFVRPMILALVFFGAPFWALHAVRHVERIGWDSLAILAASSFLYSFSVYFLTFNDSERSYVRDFYKMLLKKAGR
jgi:O-antigen/teichoic acid export membrane protein